MSVSKRDVLKGLFVGGIVTQMPTASWAIPDNPQSPPTFTLNNGLRVHLSPKKSGYVSAALVLRSKHIDDPRGLAHIMEHTSFTGVAGSMTAKQIKVQDAGRVLAPIDFVLKTASSAPVTSRLPWRAELI